MLRDHVSLHIIVSPDHSPDELGSYLTGQRRADPPHRPLRTGHTTRESVSPLAYKEMVWGQIESTKALDNRKFDITSLGQSRWRLSIPEPNESAVTIVWFSQGLYGVCRMAGANRNESSWIFDHLFAQV